MRRHSQIIVALALALLMVTSMGCGSDKSTSPATPQDTPPELVGTWQWSSAVVDGTPITSFADVSYTDTSTAQELEFIDGGTWETREFYLGTGPVFTRGGICHDDDSLYITCNSENGSPVSGECLGYIWDVATQSEVYAAGTAVPPGPILTLTTRIQKSAGEIITAVSLYYKLPS